MGVSLLRLAGFTLRRDSISTLRSCQKPIPIGGEAGSRRNGLLEVDLGGEPFIGKRCAYWPGLPSNLPEYARKWRFVANGHCRPLAETLRNVTARSRKEMIFRMMVS